MIRSNNVQNNIVQEYVLPDFSSRRLGRLRKQGEHLSDTDQILRMSNERFLVPEILFRPDDIGALWSKQTIDLLPKLPYDRVSSSRHPASNCSLHRALAAEAPRVILG
jgi:hypothetical protein